MTPNITPGMIFWWGGPVMVIAVIPPITPYDGHRLLLIGEKSIMWVPMMLNRFDANDAGWTALSDPDNW